MRHWLKNGWKNGKSSFNRENTMPENNPFSFPKYLLPLYITFFFFTASVPTVLADSDSPFLLFFSGNVQGETEPCG
jgi:hypothetical protein